MAENKRTRDNAPTIDLAKAIRQRSALKAASTPMATDRNYNAAITDIFDPARMLISPPPEETLRRMSVRYNVISTCTVLTRTTESTTIYTVLNRSATHQRCLDGQAETLCGTHVA